MEVSPANVPHPQAQRVLKRSASTASLPTPPRTYSRRGRGRSRGSCDSDNGEEQESSNRVDALSSTDEDDSELPQLASKGLKKRRLSKRKGVEDDEEAFWVDEELKQRDKAPRGDLTSAPLLYRKSLQRSRSQSSNGLTSPPPSHRKRQTQAVPNTPPTEASELSNVVLVTNKSTSLPSTPKRQTGPANRTRNKGPKFPIISDSPDNPFYEVPASPSPGADSESPRVSDSPRTPGASGHYEKPTVTYVFRGVRREYQNPLYNHAKNRPLSPPPNSQLPIDHPDYSPDMTCKPTVLFPNARKGKRGIAGAATAAASSLRRSPRRKRIVVGDSEDEGEMGGSENRVAEEAEDVIKPRKLDFGLPKNAAKSRKTRVL